MSILVDTNVLLRRVQPSHASHAVAVESVARLLAAGEAVYFTLQNEAVYFTVQNTEYSRVLERRHPPRGA